jgi:hypothetical protein
VTREARVKRHFNGSVLADPIKIDKAKFFKSLGMLILSCITGNAA